MTQLQTSVSLKGGQIHITENENEAFRVVSGTVLVFIAPMHGSFPGRRSFVYEAHAGEMLPSFRYKDIEYVNWRFCFAAVDTAEIECIPNGCTKILRDKFADKIRLANYPTDGFNACLVDRYRLDKAAEDAFIIRTLRTHGNTRSNLLGLLFSAFTKNDIRDYAKKSDNRLYDTVSVICRRQQIEPVAYDLLKEACPDSFDVTDIARVSRFAYREILLTDGWQTRDNGPLLVFDTDKNPYACLPKGDNSYLLYSTQDDTAVPVSKEIAFNLQQAKAYMFYRPLPSKTLNGKDCIAFCAATIKKTDILRLAFLIAATSLIGLLTPVLSQSLYDSFIPLGNKAVLVQFGALFASFMFANILFSIVKNIVSFRITSRMGYEFQAAVYDRLFNLPESFFRRFESADLAQRIMQAGTIASESATQILSGGAALVFALVYFIAMAAYNTSLATAGFLMVAVWCVLCFLIALRTQKFRRKSAVLEGKTQSMMYQFLNGIAKIRIAGMEDRALYEYMKPYIQRREYDYRTKKIADLGTVLTGIASTVFSIVLYILVMQKQDSITLGTFIAFQSLFGSFAAFAMQFTQAGAEIFDMRPEMQRLQSVLQEAPESDNSKEQPGDLSGGIEINNVSFSYGDDSPNVLNNLSLNIRPGEYVAIVGPSGCGKSTLLKLLLGFEKPTSGRIYYDNKDIDSLDKRELRKKMGVVLQDGSLIAGSIFENIALTYPAATQEDVMQAIRSVGLEKDVASMPMGLNTMLSENCGTISGGQQQRILIARAIISDPKILFLDEATSALDNITQSMVAETVGKMQATRIVIAHRLSTIKACERIIVLDNGTVAEEGTYDELVAKDGLFSRLASRQTI
ncbi:MAG: NHLP bacteriocin export ABC transporter permease/ATPase subunit [Clostridia bacterium]|nr:NHLP bacteriocin export ABC transporter permease/ATPase subunit [Clostridia bacterium]